MSHFRYAVIGGGIAGVSVAAELSRHADVCLFEMESALAQHTTGRSAATFLESIGNSTIRTLTHMSRDFLEHPPEFFHEKLLTSRPSIQFAQVGHESVAEKIFEELRDEITDIQLLDRDETLAWAPILKSSSTGAAILEKGAQDIDVHELHQGYVRQIRAAKNSRLALNSKVVSLEQDKDGWTLVTSSGESASASIVINAAGAWVDDIAAKAGARPIGIRPHRRSIFMVPAEQDYSGLPMIGDLDNRFYLRPESGQLLCSPADETPSIPGDAKADTLEIARAIESINDLTSLSLRSVRTSWAGLRSFTSDHTPVVGFDPVVENFYWFAGQGGYGIQTAPTLANIAVAQLNENSELPEGAPIAELSPKRFVRAHEQEILHETIPTE